MEIVQIVLFGITAAVLYMLLKDVEPSFAYLVIIITSIVILIVVIKQVGIIIQLLKSLSDKAAIESFYLEIILKIIGIAYITELGANVTKDAGLTSVSANIELAGKIFILLLAIPIISAVIEVVLSFIPITGTDFLGG